MANKKYCRIVSEIIDEEKGRWNYYLQFSIKKEWKTSTMTRAFDERISDSILWELNHYVLKQEAAPVLQKVFDKYIGKRIGEKTKDKIRGEFKELGLYVWWHCEYSSTFKFEVCLSEHNYSSFKLYLYDGIYDENGKLKQLNFNDMICYEVSKYIENAEERIAEMERLEKEISEKTEELNKIISSHYNLCVSGMEIYDTVYIKRSRR